jgi:hypothetical protein
MSARPPSGKLGQSDSDKEEVRTMSTPAFMNLTLRAARWSAAHPWRAVLGWLAFVLARSRSSSAAR